MNKFKLSVRVFVSFNLVCIFLMVGKISVAGQTNADYRAVPTGAVGSAAAINDEARPAATQVFHISFALNSANKSAIADFVNSLSNPSSANYHKWITPTQFGEKFGATASDISTLSSYLESKGFSGIKVWPDHLFVSAQAQRSTVETALGISIHGYNRSLDEVARGLSTTYYAPDSLPKVSTTIAPHLSGIFGLSSASELMPALTRPDAGSASQAAGLDPAQLAQVYDVASLHNNNLLGQGETIAIFSPTAYRASDISSFLSLNSITSSDINIVEVDGGTRSLDNEDEACIDIETAVGQAPDAAINVYEGPNNNSFDIFEQIETDDPDICSESYGSEENTVSQSYADSYETIRSAMAAEGISIFVATGDEGAYASIRPLSVGVSVDASSDFVTAVGGTELDALSDGNWNGEIGWTFNDGTLGNDTGSAGGLSTFYSEPSWQTGPGVSNSNSNGMRQIPDVASLASTPYINIYADGEYTEFGGTSCATPFWAASMALIEQSLGTRLGNIDPILYSIGTNDPSAFHDITSGNNGVYACTAGWDFVTGWGSGNFSSLLTAFEQYSLPTVATPTISPDGGSFTTAQTVTLSDPLSGSTIYYTTDGSQPTTSSNSYSSPFTVASSKTITAIAAKSGYINSLSASASFGIGQSVPTPTFNPGGGTYSTARTVTISDTNAASTIYYTTDGSTPTTSSTLYTAAITVSSSETINAVAVESGYVNSTVAAAVYTIGAPATAPVISPAGGTYPTSQTVTITDSVSGGSIYYTTDGSTPTTSSTLYTGAITVSSSESINAIAVAPGYTSSSVTTASFTIYSLVPTPTISPDGGTFTSAQSVSIAETLGGASIYYTTDGSSPTTSSTLYTAPITVSSSSTINAIAVVAGYTISNTASAAFTINYPAFASFSSGLQMISLPATYNGVSLDSIFGYTGVTLAVWSPSDNDYALTPTSPADGIAAGQGYWVRFPQAVSITNTGTETPTSSPFTIALSAGWNMIGDPFNSAISLSNVSFNGATFSEATSTPSQLIGASIYGYDSSSNSYVSAASLEPGQGYWIFAYSAVNMIIPAP